MKRKSRFLIGALILTMCASMLFVPVSADTVDANETLYYYDSFDADTALDQIKGNWTNAPDYSWPDGWGDSANGWYSGTFSYEEAEGRGQFVKYKNDTSGAVQANMKMNVSENTMLSNLDWKTFTGNLVFSYDFKLPEQNDNTTTALNLLERPALKYHYTDKDGNAQSFVVAELPHIEIKAAGDNYSNGIYINTPGKSLVNNGSDYGVETITEFASANDFTKSDAFFEVTAEGSGYKWGDWVNFETVISKVADGSYTVRCYLDGNVIYNRFYNLAKKDWGWSGAGALTAFAAYKVTSDPMAAVTDYTPKGFTCFDGITAGLVKTPVGTYVGFDNFKMTQYTTTTLPEHISVDETTAVTEIPVYNSISAEQSPATQGYIVANRIPGGNNAITISSVKIYTGYNQTSSTTVSDHGITVDLSGIDSIRLNIPENIKQNMKNGDRYQITFNNLYDIIGSRQGKYEQSKWLYNVAGQNFTNSTVIISGKDYDSTYKNVTLRAGSSVVTNDNTKYALVNDIRVDTRDTVDASDDISLKDEEGNVVSIKPVTFDTDGDGTEATNWKVQGRYYIKLADNACLVGGTTYRILKGDNILTTIVIPESATEFSVKDIKLNNDKKPTATFENRTKSPVTYMFIVAEYDNANKNELDEAALKRYTVKSGERYWETLDLKITDPEKTYTLFVWDENLTPFVNAIPVQVQN